jgi:hypothetical protein
MNSNREELLFGLALTKPAAERARFLDRECGEDKALRQRLDALLAAHEQTDTLLATQAGPPRNAPDLTDAPDEAVGQTLGRYKLLERIGEGGCGVVYVAEQIEPVRRRVALKVIKLGMDTKQVVARFEAERQALAIMDHPNIAKVLDAVTTGPTEPRSSGRESAPTASTGAQSRLTSSATLWDTSVNHARPSYSNSHFRSAAVCAAPAAAGQAQDPWILSELAAAGRDDTAALRPKSEVAAPEIQMRALRRTAFALSGETRRPLTPGTRQSGNKTQRQRPKN